MYKAIENYRKTFDGLSSEIRANTEQYRKGDFTLRLLFPDGSPVRASVRAVQKSHDFNFGTNVLMLGSMGDQEQAYRDAVTDLFNFVTTTFCWNCMETEPGKFRFAEGSEEMYRRPPADRVLTFAKENNLRAKGQPLFCARWCPEWVPHDTDTLKNLWTKFVTAVAQRYDGEYYTFDVVNESYQRHFEDMGVFKNLWISESATSFVKWLLKRAGEIFSRDCIMARNETTHVNFGPHADYYYEENRQLLEEGVRLDSIGFQVHFFNGASCLEKHISGEAGLENIYKTYHKMATLGIPMSITEITVPTVFEGMSLPEGEELQAEILEYLYRLWFSIPHMSGITYWNLKDGDAWKSEGSCRGCLIDENLRRKPSYLALERLIRQEWNTNITTRTDDAGTLSFRGFYGNYELTIEAEDQAPVTRTASFTQKTDSLTLIL